MKTSKKTFIVDDDPFWTAMFTRMLHTLGFANIETYASGTACIENLHRNPDLVFLDYQMEDVNGLDVLQRIKDHNPSIDVIFCTSFEDLSVAVDALDCGSFDYLLKGNATKGEVSTIVSNLLN